MNGGWDYFGFQVILGDATEAHDSNYIIAVLARVLRVLEHICQPTQPTVDDHCFVDEASSRLEPWQSSSRGTATMLWTRGMDACRGHFNVDRLMTQRSHCLGTGIQPEPLGWGQTMGKW